jgi:integration host factor subunit beta
MTRSELVEAIARRKGEFGTDDVRMAVSLILEDMAGAIAEGRRIELRGFGAFTLSRQPARTVRNPRTGAMVKISERYKTRFKAGKELLKRVQEEDEAKEP